MNFLEMMVLNVIYISFPILLYLFYFSYARNLKKSTKKLVLDFCFLTSFYFLVRFGEYNNTSVIILLANIPLLIAYISDNKLSVFVLSFLIIINSNDNIRILLVLEYIMYYLLYLKTKDSNRQDITFIVGFVISKIGFYILYNIYIIAALNIFIDLVMFVLLVITVLILLKNSRDIINLRMTLNDLKKVLKDGIGF